MKAILRFTVLLLAWAALGRTTAWAAPTPRNTTGQILQSSSGPVTLALPLSARVGTPTSYTITGTLPTAAQGVLGINGTPITALPQAVTVAQASQITFDPAAGFFGTYVFTYTATDGTGTSVAATYAIPVSNSACTDGSQLNFFALADADWLTSKSASVGGTTLTSTNVTAVAGAGTTFQIIDNATMPGKALTWSADYVASSATANATSVTFNFSRAVSGFTITLGDIDLTAAAGGTGGWIDQLVVDGYSATNALITLGAADYQLGSNNVNTYSGNNAFTGTAANGTVATESARGNIVISFPQAIAKLTLTYRNIITGSTNPSLQVATIPAMSWCAEADVAATLSGPARATAGTSVTYTASITNNGVDVPTSIRPTVQLAPGLAGVTGGTYDNASGLLTLAAIPNLAAGTTVTRAISFTMPATTTTGKVSVPTTGNGSTTAGTSAQEPGTAVALANSNGTLANANVTTVVNQLPTATAATNALVLNTAGATALTPSLAGTDPDGTVSSFLIKSLPAAGTLTYNGAAATIGTSVPNTAASLALLRYAPAAGQVSTTSFTFAAVDNEGGESTAAATYTIPVQSPTFVAGTVFEDVNYGGGAGRPITAAGTTSRPDATVELYDGSGNFVASQKTDVSGRYSFAVSPGAYTVRVVNATVTSSRPGSSAGLLPVQTYNGSPDRVGGENPALADAPATGVQPNTLLRIEGRAVNGTDNTAFIDQVEILDAGGNPVSGAVANPSFETPNQSGGFSYNTAGGSFTFNANSGIAAFGSDFGPATPPNGTQVGIVQTAAVAGVISQSLTLPVGTYSVRFRARQRGTQAQTLRVLINGTEVLASFTPSTTNYDQYTSSAFTTTNVMAGSGTLASLSTTTATPQSVAAVSVASGATAGADFGFNFSTIVNANESGQGSLRQFALNSNQLTNAGLDQAASSNGGPDPAAGTETSIFMMSDGLTHAGLRAGLPNQLTGAAGAARAVISLSSTVPFSDAGTSLDATTQTLNVGNTNAGLIGTSETVGTDGLTLTALSRPEVEVVGVGVAGSVLSVTGASATLRQLALRGGSGQTVSFGTGATGFLVDETLVGTSAISYGWANDNTVSTTYGINVSGTGAFGTVQGSIVAFTGNSGINVSNGLRTSAVLTIRDSEFNQNGYTDAGGDGITLGDVGGSGPALIEGNLFTRPNSSAVQFEIGRTSASVVRNNSIISAGKGGAGTALNQLEGGGIVYLQRDGTRRGTQADVISKNVIVDTQASGIVVGYGQQNVTISQNSIFNSGSIAIDLVNNANAFVQGPNGGNDFYGSGDGVTVNDGNDPAAAAATLPNRGADFPVLTSLDIIGSSLVVEGFSRPGAVVEFFIPALDPTRFGEGRTYLVTRTEGSGDDALAGTGAYGPSLVNNLAQGQDASASRFRFTLPFGALSAQQQNDIRNLGLTATATLNNSTSEFSGNVPFAADVVAAITAQATPVAAGTLAQFNVKFTNVGASVANGVRATVQLPVGLSVTSVSGGGTYEASTGLVSYPGITTIQRSDEFVSVISYTQPLTGASVTATAALITTTSQNGLTANDAQSATILSRPLSFDLRTTLAGPATTGAGQPLTYAVTTQNAGPNTALNAVQTVSVPTAAALTNVFVSNGGTYAFGGGTSTFTFPVPASLPAGQLLSNTFSFTAPASGPLSFTALLTPTASADGEQTPANNTASLSTTITAAPSTVANVYTLISSNAANGSVPGGASVTYTVQQGNQGPSAATDVVTSVSLRPNLTSAGFTVAGASGSQPGGAGTPISFALSGGSATYNPATGQLTLPAVTTQASGALLSYVLVVPAPANGLSTVTSSVTATTADPVPADNVASSQVTVTNALTTDLSTTIVGPAAATAAQLLVYTITTTNNGAGLAQNVVQTVLIPAGLPITGPGAVQVNGLLPTSSTGTVASYGTGPGAATYDAASGIVSIPLPTAVAGAGTSTLNTVGYNAPVSDGDQVNVAAVRTSSTDNVPANNTAQVVTTVQPQADVQVLLDGPRASVVGAPITFVVTVTNLGPSLVPSQTVTVQLPSTLGFTGGVEVRDNAGNLLAAAYDNLTGIVTLPAIINQSSGAASGARYTLSFITPAGSVFSPSATTNVPATLDPNLGNNTTSISVSVSPATTAPRPDLLTSFAAGTSTTATAGQPLTLVVQTANAAGAAPGTGIVQDVMLPAGLTTTGFTVGGTSGTLDAATGLIQFARPDGPATYSPATGLLSYPVANQAAGASITTTIGLTAPGTGPLAVTAAVRGNQTEDVTTNNRATTILTISPVDDVQTTVAGPVAAPVGSRVTYSVVTINNGPSNAQSVRQTVTLPAGATNVVISGGGTIAGNLVTFPTLTTQEPGATGTVSNTISFDVPGTTPSISVRGDVTATGDNAAGGNNTSTQETATLPNRPPVAADVVNDVTAPDASTATARLPIKALQATDPDGAVASFTLLSFPDPATTGTLYVNGTAVTAARTLTLAEAAQLSFTPRAGYVGNVFFTYSATDNGNGTPALALGSNVARYTLQVGLDNASRYVVNTVKGGTAGYLNGDEIARVFDFNGGKAVAPTAAGTDIFSPNPADRSADYGSGVSDNGLRTVTTNAAGTALLAGLGLVLDPTTGRITVADRTKLVAGTYTLTITTTDVYGGITTQDVTFPIGARPLPVELTAFEAKAAGADAQLSWTTATEKNNDHFDVERSLDGGLFTKIGQVAGQGTKASPSSYAFADAGIGRQASGLVYYRLRQVDADGTAAYSPVRVLSFPVAATAPTISIYPVPAQAQTTLNLSALPAARAYQVQLTDLSGRLVGRYTLAGGAHHALDLSRLASGSYLVDVRGLDAQGGALHLVKRLTKE